MSTRSSRTYWSRGQFEFHWYHEFMDDNDHVEITVGRSDINVVVWRGLRYWHRPAWFARLMCRIGKHDWFISEIPERASQKPDGLYNLTGRWSYKCQKCGLVRVESDYGPPYKTELGEQEKAMP